MLKFSVLMAVCASDSEAHLQRALRSIWNDQTIKPDEIVIVKDGPLPVALEQIVEEFRRSIGTGMKVIGIPDNIGLGSALNKGLNYCSHELVARMDSDDVSLPDRFATQVRYMSCNPDIAASSAWVEEYDQDMVSKLSTRVVPEGHEDIARFARKRNPLSHPVVIFRKSAVEAVGGYPPLRKSQDYALWSLMLLHGYRMANIPSVLLYMRAGTGLLQRRGFAYFKHEVALLAYQRRIGFIGTGRYVSNILLRGVIRLQPNFIKKLLYKLAR